MCPTIDRLLYWRSKGVVDPFCACAINRWSTNQGQKIRHGQGRFSTIKSLDPGRSSGYGAYGSASW